MPDGRDEAELRKVVFDNFDMSLSNGLGKVARTCAGYSSSTVSHSSEALPRLSGKIFSKQNGGRIFN